MKDIIFAGVLFTFGVLFSVVLLKLVPYDTESDQEDVPVVTPDRTPPKQPVYLVVKCPNQTIAYRVTGDLKLNQL